MSHGESLTSVVNSEINDMHCKMYSMERQVDSFNYANEVMGDGQVLSYNDLSEIASHVKTMYPGITIRSYLSDVGFNMENVPADTFFATAEPEAYHAEGFCESGGISIRYYLDVNSISII